MFAKKYINDLWPNKAKWWHWVNGLHLRKLATINVQTVGWMALGSDVVPRERGDRGEGREESKQLCKQGRGGSKEGEGQSPENAPSLPSLVRVH